MAQAEGGNALVGKLGIGALALVAIVARNADSCAKVGVKGAGEIAPVAATVGRHADDVGSAAVRHADELGAASRAAENGGLARFADGNMDDLPSAPGAGEAMAGLGDAEAAAQANRVGRSTEHIVDDMAQDAAIEGAEMAAEEALQDDDVDP